MSIIKHYSQRVGVFIDTQNLYHSAKKLHNRKVNFANIVDDLVADRQLIRALAYVISTEEGGEENFFEALGKSGIETKTKDIQIFGDGSKKADWDVGLAMDAVRMASKLDAVIIASGDGDFVPLVQYLQQHSGIQVEVVAFERSASASLIEVADAFTDISSDPNRYLLTDWRKKRGKKK